MGRKWPVPTLSKSLLTHFLRDPPPPPESSRRNTRCVHIVLKFDRRNTRCVHSSNLLAQKKYHMYIKRIRCAEEDVNGSAQRVLASNSRRKGVGSVLNTRSFFFFPPLFSLFSLSIRQHIAQATHSPLSIQQHIAQATHSRAYTQKNRTGNTWPRRKKKYLCRTQRGAFK